MDNAYKLMAFPFVQMMMMMMVRKIIGNILLKKADKRVSRLLMVDGISKNNDDTDDIYIMMQCLSRKMSTFLKGLSVCL